VSGSRHRLRTFFRPHQFVYPISSRRSPRTCSTFTSSITAARYLAQVEAASEGMGDLRANDQKIVVW